MSKLKGERWTRIVPWEYPLEAKTKSKNRRRRLALQPYRIICSGAELPKYDDNTQAEGASDAVNGAEALRL